MKIISYSLLIGYAITNAPLLAMIDLSDAFFTKIQERIESVKAGQEDKEILNKPICCSKYSDIKCLPLLAVIDQNDERCFNVAEQLIEAGASQSIKLSGGSNMLFYTVEKGTSRAVNLLLKHGANAQRSNALFWITRSIWSSECPTKKFVAREAELVAKAYILLEHGAHPNQNDNETRETPLHFLVKTTSDIDAITKNACYQPEKAKLAQSTCYTLLSLFLRHGADPYLANWQGITSIDVAQKEDNKKLVQLLKTERKIILFTSLVLKIEVNGISLPPEIARIVAQYC